MRATTRRRRIRRRRAVEGRAPAAGPDLDRRGGGSCIIGRQRAGPAVKRSRPGVAMLAPSRDMQKGSQERWRYPGSRPRAVLNAPDIFG